MVENETITEVAKNITGNETVGSALIYMSDKLGMGVSEIYKVYVQAQFGLAIVNVFQVIIPLILVGFFIRYIMKELKDENSAFYDEIGLAFTVGIIGTILILLIGSLLIGMVGDSVVKMFCPQYGAIQEMLSIIGK